MLVKEEFFLTKIRFVQTQVVIVRKQTYNLFLQFDRSARMEAITKSPNINNYFVKNLL